VYVTGRIAPEPLARASGSEVHAYVLIVDTDSSTHMSAMTAVTLSDRGVYVEVYH